MKRRDFFKLSALTGAVAAMDSCGSPDHQLIRFIPEEDLIPGIATFKPGVCTLCPAGCGLQVRVMEGQGEVLRNGQLGLMNMGLAKKLEGAPTHPVNLGKLCARGQSGLQVVYNPDRLRYPLKRSGARGSGQFQQVSWDDAIKELVGHLTELRSSNSGASLAFLTRARRGQRNELTARFMKAFGASAPLEYDSLEDAVLRQANLVSFGHAALPTLNLASADYLICFGADFLGTWNSPVSQAIGYGAMRNARPERRGRFAQVEARMSQSGANADDWVGCKPGTEGVVALGIAHIIMAEKLGAHDTNSRAGALIDGWSKGLPDHTPENVEKISAVSKDLLERMAHAATRSPRACAVIGGPALAQTNGLFNALAANALESLIDADPANRLITFMPQPPVAGAAEQTAKVESSFSKLSALTQALLQGQAQAPKMLLVDDANPVFSAPPGLQVREAILKVPYVASFGSFLDETSSLADLILPDSAPLESWVDHIPESGSNQMVVSVAAPVLHPLYNTRPAPDVLLEVAQQIGGHVAAALPYKTFDEMLRAAYVLLRKQPGSIKADSDDDFWSMMQDMGGWWSSMPAKPAASAPGGARGASANAVSGESAEPQFEGAAGEFPFYFMPYPSQSFRDGSLANLPWLQEMPDVLTTAMWSSWVEINPKTAQKLNLQQGDWVELTSPHGSLRTAVSLSPGIAPDVLAMPMGQGHQDFGRYASGRGANPLSIVGMLTEKETGSLAWVATRVKAARVGGPEEAKLILFSGGLSRFPNVESEPR